MGRMMHELGQSAQVISITHLAQVAALGEVQFHVSKNKSKTSIKRLSDEERLYEIARMSGGEKLDKTAVDHAKTLLAAKKS
jgi:DNA repair protein RecN (Recombination protein N)